mgnify:CR=1 FL=1
MSKTTLKDIKSLIHESKNTHGQNNSTNPIIKSTNTEKHLSNEKQESYTHNSHDHTIHNLNNPLTLSADIKGKILESQESETQSINIEPHNSNTNLLLNFNNNTDNIICIKRKNPHNPVKKRKPAITQEHEILLKKLEGKFTIKELSDKLNLPTSSLYSWAKKNHYQVKNGNIHPSISKELGKKLLNQLNTMSIADLAKEYHLSYHVVYYWIKKQGLCTKKSSTFPEHIQQELREKCYIFSLKELAQNYGLSEQTMRSRLKNIGCFSDGQGGFLIVDESTSEEIKSFYYENDIDKTAAKFHTTKTAIKSFLKNKQLNRSPKTLEIIQ